jgi:hypothetical protein
MEYWSKVLRNCDLINKYIDSSDNNLLEQLVKIEYSRGNIDSLESNDFSISFTFIDQK